MMKIYRVPATQAWWPAIRAMLERIVRHHTRRTVTCVLTHCPCYPSKFSMTFFPTEMTRSMVISTPFVLNLSSIFPHTVSFRTVSSSSCPEFVRLRASAAAIRPSPDFDSRIFALMYPASLSSLMLYATSCSSKGGISLAFRTVFAVLDASSLLRIARMIVQFLVKACLPLGEKIPTNRANCLNPISKLIYSIPVMRVLGKYHLPLRWSQWPSLQKERYFIKQPALAQAILARSSRPMSATWGPNQQVEFRLTALNGHSRLLFQWLHLAHCRYWRSFWEHPQSATN